MAERAGLENRCLGNWTEGSNPSLSAKTPPARLTPIGAICPLEGKSKRQGFEQGVCGGCVPRMGSVRGGARREE